MAKQVFCAECGMELFFILKALPKQAMTVTLVEPHSCLEDYTPEFLAERVEERDEAKPVTKERPASLDHLFDSFKTVQKINDLKEEPILKDLGPGDRRDPEFQKKIDTTTAPLSVISALGQIPLSEPTHEDFGDPDREE